MKSFILPSTPSLCHRTWWASATYTGLFMGLAVPAVLAAPPVPGYVAPVAQAPVGAYVDDTRGVYIPAHEQLRGKTDLELGSWERSMPTDAARPLYAQKNPNGPAYQQALNEVATGVADTGAEIDRIAQDPGLLSGGRSMQGAQMAQLDSIQPAAGNKTRSPNLERYPSLATGGQARASTPADIAPAVAAPMAAPSRATDGGVELAVGQATARGDADLQNGIVKLKEERISVRRALQRMLDQVGGGGWTTVWDLDEVNAGLPDMEISIYTEEPFVKVLNAMLARLQTRSGQPLRVIKYDKTQRLVITDRSGGDAQGAAGVGPGSGASSDVAITETVLKEATVSLHYDEVPLVDALENIVNQAGKGQWRLRMYAGTDQVLKPAHIEEPFGMAVERILKVFNLKYEVFPGGKLIVVTGNDLFGFRGVGQ